MRRGPAHRRPLAAARRPRPGPDAAAAARLGASAPSKRTRRAGSAADALTAPPGGRRARAPADRDELRQILRLPRRGRLDRPLGGLPHRGAGAGRHRPPGPVVASRRRRRRFRCAVIGAGASGLAAAYRLRQAGVTVTVFEKNADVGGTWLENVYPGCRVDVPNQLYSFSFAQTNDWASRFSAQPDLLAYLQGTGQGARPRRVHPLPQRGDRGALRRDGATLGAHRARRDGSRDGTRNSTRSSARWDSSTGRPFPPSPARTPSPAPRSTRPPGTTRSSWPAAGSR